MNTPGLLRKELLQPVKQFALDRPFEVSDLFDETALIDRSYLVQDNEARGVEEINFDPCRIAGIGRCQRRNNYRSSS